MEQKTFSRLPLVAAPAWASELKAFNSPPEKAFSLGYAKIDVPMVVKACVTGASAFGMFALHDPCMAAGGVKGLVNTGSVANTENRTQVDLVIALGKHTTLDEIKLLVPSARRMFLNNQEFALVSHHPSAAHALVKGRQLQASLPWPLEILVYPQANASASRAAAKPTWQTSANATISPRSSIDHPRSSANSAKRAKASTQSNSSKLLGPPLQWTSPYSYVYGYGNSWSPQSPKSTQNQSVATARPGSAPELRHSQPSAQSASSASTPSSRANQSTQARKIIPPITSETQALASSTPAEAVLPADRQSSAAIATATPLPSNQASSPKSIQQQESNQLNYLMVAVATQQDRDNLSKIAPIAAITKLDGQTYAQVGVYNNSRVGNNLLTQRESMLRLAGLSVKVVGTSALVG